MNHYPGIRYFVLAKAMPGAEVGTVVNVGTADGSEKLWIVDDRGFCHIELKITMAEDYPDWFTPVTEEEHVKICKENTINYLMTEHQCPREDAEAKYEKFITA